MAEGKSHSSTYKTPATVRPRVYRIELGGPVDPAWMAAFSPLSVTSSAGVTWIEVLVDQAGLRGILNRSWDLNLNVLSVVAIDQAEQKNGGS